MEWSYFDKFEAISDKYLPTWGEGNSVATQIVTAVNKLVYKWYNDGDVFDNTRYLTGWCNDLSSYANWLYNNTKAAGILERVFDCINGDEYERLLADLADTMLDGEFLASVIDQPKVGSVYKCDGPFQFVEPEEEDFDEDEDFSDEEDEDEDFSDEEDEDEDFSDEEDEEE